MKTISLDRKLRSQVTHLLVPVDNIICIEEAEDGDLETTKIHLETTDGMAFLNAKEWKTPGGNLQDYIEANL